MTSQEVIHSLEEVLDVLEFNINGNVLFATTTYENNMIGITINDTNKTIKICFLNKIIPLKFDDLVPKNLRNILNSLLT